MKRAVQKQHVCSDCNYIKEHMHIGPDEILYIMKKCAMAKI